MTSQNSLPRHIAIIMDGNGRWAQQRGEQRGIGHNAGTRTAIEIVRHCDNLGIECLTLFAFSTENWGRPDTEVNWLMGLFSSSLKVQIAELHERGARLRFIGDRSGLPEKLRKQMEQAEEWTAGNTGLQFSVAVSYGGQQEIALLARELAREVKRGELDADAITQDLITQRLALGHLPPPDLFIRTGGELRISNFLLWQLAYAELYFCDTLWPEFDGAALDKAIDWYRGRDRRFGLLKDEQD